MSEFSQKPGRREHLAAAKGTFRTNMLASDAFFSLLQYRNAVDMHTELRRDMPAFGCEPIIVPQDDGTQEVGVRVSYSRQENLGGLSESSVEMRLFEDIYMGMIDPKKGAFNVHPALAYEMGIGAPDLDPNAGATDIATNWLAGYNGIIREVSDLGVTIDPDTHTMILPEDIVNHSTEE